MKSRRMWAGIALAIAIAVGSGSAIPAAAGASPQIKTDSTTPLCTAKGKMPMGKAGAISLIAKGSSSSSTGTTTSCRATVKGRWAKNSSTFSIDDIGTATLGTGGTFTVDPKTNLKPFTGKVAGTLTGSGLPTGTAIWVEIHCWHSYPPLKFGCEIIIHSGPPPTGAPHRSVDAAPQMTTGSTPLCKATGTKPLGNTGVVNVTLKNSNSAGAADICTGKITGKWKKNSTSFSWATSGPVTLGAGGTFRALSGPVMGPAGKATGTLTGSGLPAGSNITVDAGCQITYPPLKIRCWIIVSAA